MWVFVCYVFCSSHCWRFCLLCYVVTCDIVIDFICFLLVWCGVLLFFRLGTVCVVFMCRVCHICIGIIAGYLMGGGGVLYLVGWCVVLGVGGYFSVVMFLC